MCVCVCVCVCVCMCVCLYVNGSCTRTSPDCSDMPVSKYNLVICNAGYTSLPLVM